MTQQLPDADYQLNPLLIRIWPEVAARVYTAENVERLARETLQAIIEAPIRQGLAYQIMAAFQAAEGESSGDQVPGNTT